MDFFKEILITKSESHITSSALLCENAHNHNIFKEEKRQNLSAHIKSITLTLTGKECKRAALAHLLVLLPQCTKDFVAMYGHRWIRDCAQILKVKEDITLTPGLLTVIRVVLKCTTNNRELLNNVSKLNGSFLPQIYSVDSEFGESACLCLSEFLHLFPVQALQHKNAIEAMLMSFLGLPLSASSASKVTSAARCFAFLPVPGQTVGVKQVKRMRLDQLISLTHSVMDELFKDIRENEKYSFSRAHKLPVRTLDFVQEVMDSDPLQRLLIVASLTGHCFDFVRVFLESTVTEVLPRELVRLILRVLQVNFKVYNCSVSIESLALAFVLPSIHASAIRLLQRLIGSNLCEPYEKLIEEQLVATLIATHQPTEDKTHKTNLIVKHLCYQTITQLIRVSGGFHAASLKTLIPVLVTDTLSKTSTIELKTATRGARLALWNTKKKGKKKGYTIVPTQDAATDDTQEEALPDVASDFIPSTVAALNLLEALFLHCQHLLTGEVIRKLQRHLWDMLALLRRGVFADVSLRTGLYSALIAYALQPHPLCPPPYTSIHRALEEGRRDSHLTVARLCSQGLATLSFVAANPSVSGWADAAWQTGLTTTEKTEAATAAKKRNVGDEATQNDLLANGERGDDKENKMGDDEPGEEMESDVDVEMEEDLLLSTPRPDVIVDNTKELAEAKVYDRHEVGTETYASERKGATESYSKAADDTKRVGAFDTKEVEDETPDPVENEGITILDSFLQEDATRNSSQSDDNETGESSAEDEELCSELTKKRKKTDEESTEAKKCRTNDTDNTRTSRSLDEMLAAFVDADPDSD